VVAGAAAPREHEASACSALLTSARNAAPASLAIEKECWLICRRLYRSRRERGAHVLREVPAGEREELGGVGAERAVVGEVQRGELDAELGDAHEVLHALRAGVGDRSKRFCARFQQYLPGSLSQSPPYSAARTCMRSSNVAASISAWPANTSPGCSSRAP
jgi:hypothetical protein